MPQHQPPQMRAFEEAILHTTAAYVSKLRPHIRFGPMSAAPCQIMIDAEGTTPDVMADAETFKCAGSMQATTHGSQCFAWR